MTWRRCLFLAVFVTTWPFLFVLFCCGYLAEGARRQIERLERWSKEGRNDRHP